MPLLADERVDLVRGNREDALDARRVGVAHVVELPLGVGTTLARRGGTCCVDSRWNLHKNGHTATVPKYMTLALLSPLVGTAKMLSMYCVYA